MGSEVGRVSRREDELSMCAFSKDCTKMIIIIIIILLLLIMIMRESLEEGGSRGAHPPPGHLHDIL